MLGLNTERLTLRNIEFSDIEIFQKLFSDPEVMRFSDGVLDKDAVSTWITNVNQSYVDRGFGPYAVLLDGQVIGYCGLFYFPDINGSPEVEIGFRLLKDYWGKGYATEAAQAVRDYAFDNLKLDKLICIIEPDNTDSISVAEKLGMSKEGEVMLEGYTHPDYVYSITK